MSQFGVSSAQNPGLPLPLPLPVLLGWPQQIFIVGKLVNCWQFCLVSSSPQPMEREDQWSRNHLTKFLFKRSSVRMCFWAAPNTQLQLKQVCENFHLPPVEMVALEQQQSRNFLWNSCLNIYQRSVWFPLPPTSVLELVVITPLLISVPVRLSSVLRKRKGLMHIPPAEHR